MPIVTGWTFPAGGVVQRPANSIVSLNGTLAPCTAAQLPAAGFFQGMRGLVNDANSTAFFTIVAGGGTGVVPVYSNGTNWIIG